MTKHRFILLDGLRGVAAIGIVIHHAGKTSFPALDGLYLLVDFFFVLSGFVLQPSLPTASESRRQQTWHFIARRFIRFWPMVVAVLVFRFALWVQWELRDQPDVAFGHSPALTHLPTSLVGAGLLLQIIVPSAAQWNGALWSLSAEWWSNLFAIPFAASRRDWGLYVGLFLGYAFLALGWILNQPAIFGARAFGRAVVGFFIGMIVRRWFDRKAKQLSLLRLGGALALVAAFFVYQQRYGSGGLLLAAPVFAILILQVARIPHKSVPNTVLVTSTFLGTMSFGIYAWHPNVYMLFASLPSFASNSIQRTDSILQLLVATILITVVSVALTIFTIRLIERPLQTRWAHFIERRLVRAS
jgi:peptidoglycan/LPS O-acetylase OafA/YrhL